MLYENECKELSVCSIIISWIKNKLLSVNKAFFYIYQIDFMIYENFNLALATFLNCIKFEKSNSFSPA